MDTTQDTRTIGYLCYLADTARDPLYGPPLEPLVRVGRLVEVQRTSAEALRQAVSAARGAGATWATLGAATGLSVPTVWRQVASGGPVVVVRPKHAKHPTPDAPTLPDGCVQDPLFDLADLAA